MKKNQKSEKRNFKSRNRAKKLLVFHSNNHRVHDNDFDADYDALYDEIDQCDWAVSERFFLEDFDRKSQNQRA